MTVPHIKASLQLIGPSRMNLGWANLAPKPDPARHKRPRHAVSAGAVSLRIPFLERYWFHPRNKPCADAL
jgi:hypothetical protein